MGAVLGYTGGFNKIIRRKTRWTLGVIWLRQKDSRSQKHYMMDVWHLWLFHYASVGSNPKVNDVTVVSPSKNLNPLPSLFQRLSNSTS